MSNIEITFWFKLDVKEEQGMGMARDKSPPTIDAAIVLARKLIKEKDIGRIIIEENDELVYHYHIKSHHKWCGTLAIGEVYEF